MHLSFNPKIMISTIAVRQNTSERLKNISFFEADKRLFQSKFPRHFLNKELNSANIHTKDRLSASMIYHLLTVVEESDIINNRNLSISDSSTDIPSSEEKVFKSISKNSSNQKFNKSSKNKKKANSKSLKK